MAIRASTLSRPRTGRRIELARELIFGRASQHNMIIGPPFDHEVPAGNGDRRLAV